MKTKLKDHVIDLEITSDNAISVMSSDFHDLMEAVATLHGTIPMVSYGIARVGLTDVWNVTATAVDTRVYTSTVTITAGVPKYTLASLPQGTAAEIAAFLSVVQVFARCLKIAEVSAATIGWS